MYNTTKWLSKARKDFELIYNRYKPDEDKDMLSDTERQALIEELGNSLYSLEKVNTFLTNCTHKYRFTCGLVTINVMCNKVCKKLRVQIIKTLYRANTILKMFSGNNIKRITFTLVPVNEPRTKPTGINTVKPYHINGGYTYIHGEHIYIYRLEEWPKVALHELLHKIPKLQDIRWSSNIIRKLYTTFRIDTTGCPEQCNTYLEPTEGVIEAWAIFLHTAFISFEMEGDFERLLRDEIRWNDHQIQWILKKQEAQGDGKWREGTHAFSYLVLRGIILHNIDVFLEMPIPYDPDALYRFWENGWNNLELNPIGVYNKRSMRMSRYGDV